MDIDIWRNTFGDGKKASDLNKFKLKDGTEGWIGFTRPSGLDQKEDWMDKLPFSLQPPKSEIISERGLVLKEESNRLIISFPIELGQRRMIEDLRVILAQLKNKPKGWKRPEETEVSEAEETFEDYRKRVQQKPGRKKDSLARNLHLWIKKQFPIYRKKYQKNGRSALDVNRMACQAICKRLKTVGYYGKRSYSVSTIARRVPVNIN